MILSRTQFKKPQLVTWFQTKHWNSGSLPGNVPRKSQRTIQRIQPSCRANLERPGIIGLLKCHGERNGKKKQTNFFWQLKNTLITWYVWEFHILEMLSNFKHCDGQQRFQIFATPHFQQILVQTGNWKPIKEMQRPIKDQITQHVKSFCSNEYETCMEIR